MMQLDEAIKHCEEKAEELGCTECGEEHRQLAEWLTDYKNMKEKQKPTRDYIEEMYGVLRDITNLRHMKESIDHHHWIAMCCADDKDPFCFSDEVTKQKYKEFVLSCLEELEGRFRKEKK